jgi:hypothetical protein
MSRKVKGGGLLIAGVIIFGFSFLMMLPIEGLYVVSLAVMFGGIVLVGIGGAMAKGYESSLDAPAGDCYFCKGTGKVPGVKGPETCPRCGGTGKSRPDE